MIHNPLKAGDIIGVMAPSSFVEKEAIERSVSALEAKGFQVFVHPQTYERENQSAGNVLQKSMAFQGLWQRDDIAAIWAAGGGNRASLLLDSIHFERVARNHKTLIGFSDVTPLLNALYKHSGVSCIHGPVFTSLHSHMNLDDVLSVLRGENVQMPMEKAIIVREGEAKGRLFGGCLSPFLLLPQTQDCPNLEGSILFLEDTGEEISRIDRMFLHLKRLGVFDTISGLILGQFHNIQDTGRSFGYSLQDIVRTHLEGTNIPVVMNAPFGHGDVLYPLVIGAEARLSAKHGVTRLVS